MYVFTFLHTEVNYEKILPFLMVLMVLFAFIACDNGGSTGGGTTNNPSTDDNDLFSEVESTLTVPVTSEDEINFIGIWDAKNVSEYVEEGFGTGEEVIEVIATVTSTKVTTLVTKIQERYICETQNVYDEMKNNEMLEGFSISFDDESKTVMATAKQEYLDSFNENNVQTYEEFIAGFEEELSGGIVTTNSTKTALKVVSVDEYGTSTQIMIKR